MNETDDATRLKGRTGFVRLRKAFGYSLDGLRSVWRHESAFRQELALALVLVPIALVVHVTPVERVLLIGSVLQVLVVELLNTAVEAAVDRGGSELHPLAKRAKDAGSAAVLVSLLIAGLTWVLLIGARVLAGADPAH